MFRGKPNMKAGNFYSHQERFDSGNVLLIQNSIIEIKPFTNKRVRESDD